jgi:hypothetical protein
VNKDQLLLEQAYSSIQLEEEINFQLRKILIEEGVWDSITGAVSKATNTVVQKGTEVVTSANELIQKVENIITLDFPNFISQMGNFIADIIMTGSAGAASSWLLGKLLIHLSKKLGQNADNNLQIVKQMLPSHVQEQIKELEDLKKTNPSEYNLKAFEFHKNAEKELIKDLTKKGIDTKHTLFIKSLNLLGNFASSGPGALLVGVISTWLTIKLGFNPVPIFGK